MFSEVSKVSIRFKTLILLQLEQTYLYLLKTSKSCLIAGRKPHSLLWLSDVLINCFISSSDVNLWYKLQFCGNLCRCIKRFYYLLDKKKYLMYNIYITCGICYSVWIKKHWIDDFSESKRKRQNILLRRLLW